MKRQETLAARLNVANKEEKIRQRDDSVCSLLVCVHVDKNEIEYQNNRTDRFLKAFFV